MGLRVSKWLLKNNPTIVKDMILAGYGEGLSSRCAGKSYGVCMSIIGEAMRSPNTRIKIIETGYITQDRWLQEQIQQIIAKLNLEGFNIYRVDNTLVYTPWTEVDIDILVKEV